MLRRDVAAIDGQVRPTSWGDLDQGSLREHKETPKARPGLTVEGLKEGATGGFNGFEGAQGG